jgi:hypothetical protein
MLRSVMCFWVPVEMRSTLRADAIVANTDWV